MYYEKPMSSQYCIKEASAMSGNTKWSSLSQEVIRRMKNTSGRVSHVTRESILTDYMRKLNRSGYPESFWCKILIKGLEGYTKIVQSEASGIVPINRPRGKQPQRQNYGIKGNGIKGCKVLHMYQVPVQLTLIFTLALCLLQNHMFQKAPENS